MSTEQQSINFMFAPDDEGLIPFKPNDKGVPPVYYSGIQNWTMCFLTNTGSRSLDPEYGTRFRLSLREGHIFTTDDVHREFAVASTIALGYCTPASRDGAIYVTQASLTNVDVGETSYGRYLVVYVAFTFSDGFETRTYLEVD